SNGVYGSTSYIMDKVTTKGNKSYFFFDDEIVALGSNISSDDGMEIHTTINQTKSNNPSINGTAITDGTDGQSQEASWAHNHKIGYVFPGNDNISVSNKQQKDLPSQ